MEVEGGITRTRGTAAMGCAEDGRVVFGCTKELDAGIGGV